MSNPHLVTDVANIIERARFDREVPSETLARQVIDTVALPRAKAKAPKFKPTSEEAPK